MPPRKSDTAGPRKGDGVDESTGGTGADEPHVSPGEKKERDKDHRDATTIEDLALPKSVITRLAKGVLPPNTQIQADAILAMNKSATVFINYLASHANENTIHANKKTISPADVFKALDDIEFSFLRKPLEAEFAKFNQIQTEKRTNYRQKTKTKTDDDDDDTDMADAIVPERDAGPRTKKARVDVVGDGKGEGPAEEDDAETDDEVVDGRDDEDDEGGDEDEDGDEDDEEKAQESGGETQDALEERVVRDDGDEALDEDDSD